jgi:hypothetical protein
LRLARRETRSLGGFRPAHVPRPTRLRPVRLRQLAGSDQRHRRGRNPEHRRPSEHLKGVGYSSIRLRPPKGLRCPPEWSPPAAHDGS